MAQLIVRKIEEKVVRKLKERAAKYGVSMEEEHRRDSARNAAEEAKAENELRGIPDRAAVL